MIDSVRIRPARQSDIDPLTAIRREAILTLAIERYGEDGAHDWAHSATADRVQRAIGEHQVFVAEIFGKPVGWVEVEGNKIEGLYVQPELAQKGIGSALLLHAERKIRFAGYLTVTLDASWNAEDFYLRRDYRPVSERSPDTGRGGHIGQVCSSEASRESR